MAKQTKYNRNLVVQCEERRVFNCDTHFTNITYSRLEREKSEFMQFVAS